MTTDPDMAPWQPEPPEANAAFYGFFYSPSADCLIAEVIGGQKRYARLFGSNSSHIEWGWRLPDDAVPLAPDGSAAPTASAASQYGGWHTMPEGSPWRLRDKGARLVGYHCWDCWRRA